MRGIDEQQERYAALDRVIENYAGEEGQLIRILQGAQEIFGYLPEEVQAYIAGKLGLPVSEVNGVVTFYSLFTTEPKGEYTINVCTGTACYVQGAQDILDDLRRTLKLTGGDTTEDGLFTVKSTRCVGACGLAPVLTVNDEVHGKFTRRDVSRLIRMYKKRSEVKAGDQISERPGTYQEQSPAGH
ncbi:NAD(P)H-dependent oxidoreductase subunit E [Desulfallas sp. Bu1-1]|uniref:NADH-quinone oxidoreductase subunit NuoE family protein n=1 Tax=Desulfallas sp. Bu1-1 TaxID=2787620 RepID=UPI00189EBCD4|nr:NAD(P)H-dependent oxidoreductase subunit E [Desulfallas sp. Bu1-1]MBF7084124.1 NAD(P)H-dependent oxidoreductase subunit E [Desulfallas sp. Bu1-1]